MTIPSLLLDLSQIHGSIAQPVNASSITITLAASDHFPNAKGDLSWFDVDVDYVGCNAITQSWLTNLNPASSTSDEEEARILTEAAYAKPFDANDPDMTEDVNSLLATIADNATALEKRQGSLFQVASAHAVKWATCASVLSCLSGKYCACNLDTSKAPGSKCQSQGGSNCCISWSNYKIKAGFFSTTFTVCNSEVEAQGKSTASCEGYGSSAQGGDVCLSNRANGCT